MAITRSETINELAAALAKAQNAMKGAKKDSENPHFRSKYADLASVWDACRGPLTDNGLSILQSPRMTCNAEGDGIVEVETMLLHSSGQWIADTISVPMSKMDAHGVGSAVTYARRYSLAAFASVAPDDDDGNAAVKGGAVANAQRWVGRPEAKAAGAAGKPAGYDDWHDTLAAAADNGLKSLEEAFKAGTPAHRVYLGQQKIDALKNKAQLVDLDEANTPRG